MNHDSTSSAASGFPLAHHFDDQEQQFEASQLGMWLFLATEVLFFGGMFAAYTIYRYQYPAAFHAASQHLNVTVGAINTAVLLLSSLMMALAVHYAQLGDNRRAFRFILETILFGGMFLAVKAYEYQHKFHEHLVPGDHFQWHGGETKGVEIFFSLYFAMTGMHALHMVIGVGLLLWVAWLARQERFSSQYFTPVEMVGLYWHFVDIVWVFLFPLLYLIG